MACLGRGRGQRKRAEGEWTTAVIGTMAWLVGSLFASHSAVPASLGCQRWR
jgi:hypothetical protein